MHLAVCSNEDLIPNRHIALEKVRQVWYWLQEVLIMASSRCIEGDKYEWFTGGGQFYASNSFIGALQWEDAWTEVFLPANGNTMPDMRVLPKLIFWMQMHIWSWYLEVIIWIVLVKSRFLMKWKPEFLEEDDIGVLPGEKLREIVPVPFNAFRVKRK